MTTNHPNRGAPSGAANPTPQQIRDARAAARLSVKDAATLVLATKRAWEGWEADEGAPGHRRMPPGLWLLFRARVQARTDPAKAAVMLLEA